MTNKIATRNLMGGFAGLLLITAIVALVFTSGDATRLQAASAPADVAQGTNITRIEVRLVTGNRDGAGTDARVWLGLGGREFNLDFPDRDDRERNRDDTYILGSSSNVSNASFNDPRSPVPLTFAGTFTDVERFPIYLRVSENGDFPDDNWNLEEVTVTINPGPGQGVFRGLPGTPNLWFFPNAGLTLYLKP